MKKILIILAFLFSFSLNGFSQDSTNVTKIYDYPNAYFEFSLGGLIPTDNSNSYFGVQFEIGKFINPIFGIGLEFQTGSESKYRDHLSYLGVNTRYKLNPLYDPNKMIRFEASAGFGYGWYSYVTGYNYDYYDYYGYYLDYDYRTKFSYVVPKVGINMYVDITRNCFIGISPEFAWYISTNKNDSENVGVINVFGKIKYNF